MLPASSGSNLKPGHPRPSWKKLTGCSFWQKSAKAALNLNVDDDDDDADDDDDDSQTARTSLFCFIFPWPGVADQRLCKGPRS